MRVNKNGNTKSPNKPKGPARKGKVARTESSLLGGQPLVPLGCSLLSDGDPSFQKSAAGPLDTAALVREVLNLSWISSKTNSLKCHQVIVIGSDC